MPEFEIFFLNNGDAIFQTDDYVTCYSDMNDLAEDFAEFHDSGDTHFWEGHDESLRIDYDFDDERNGCYEVINEVCWAELPDCKGYNAQRFLKELLNLRPDLAEPFDRP